MAEKNVLVIVEGAKTEPKLLKQLVQVFGNGFRVYSYGANIYDLYDFLQKNYGEDFNNDIPDLDLLFLLKSNEKDVEKRKILDNKFTDVLLVFDFDPQDTHQCKEEKLIKMMRYFSESTDQGRLYINYPMVESYRDIKCLNDQSYLNSKVKKSELSSYKQKVHKDSFCSDVTRYTKYIFSNIIWLNFQKIFTILGTSVDYTNHDLYEPLLKVLIQQVNLLDSKKEFYILNTCLLYLYEYYGPDKIKDLMSQPEPSDSWAKIKAP